MLIVCYGGNPDLCQPVQIATASTIKECTTVAIDSISTWTRDHPGWGFERIECQLDTKAGSEFPALFSN
jgi:hypothetical protein